MAFICALGAFLGVSFFRQMKQVTHRGWEMLSVAQYLAGTGRPQEALKLLGQLEAEHSRSRIADFALLQEANIFIRGNAFKEAVAAYQKLIERQKVKELMPLALLGSAKASEAANELDKSKEEYQNFLTLYPDHFSVAEVYEGLARVSEIKGETEKSKENLERLRVLFPDTIWSRHAESKLKILAGNK